MVRRITPSQWNNMVRQARQKQRQAVDAYNREVRAHNQRVNQAIDKYNREVRAYNARVRADRQRLVNEVARLNRQAASKRFISFRVSVTALQSAYERLERVAESGGLDPKYNEILDLSEREAANSAGLMNALLGDVRPATEPVPNPPASPLTPTLTSISADLGDRWRGALFSLNPNNPDAARHFCTSAREIITRIIDLKAPDGVVGSAIPGCERTQKGTPTRRAKIKYFLQLKGMDQNDLEAFVESDINNVVELFYVFNEGTHGAAGQFDFAQLQAIRKRVEDGILFLSRLML